MISTLLKSTNFPCFTKEDYLRGTSELNTIGELLYNIIYHYEHKNYQEKASNLKSIQRRIAHMFEANATPTFVNGHNWGYPVLCQSFALIKKDAELWQLFTQEEQSKITQCMRMFLFMWNFGCNADNWYNSGWSMRGNYFKFANSNYELTNNMLLPFLISFFEDDVNTLEKLNDIVLNLDWEAEKQQLIEFNFTNAAQEWDKPEIETPDGKGHCSAHRLIERGGRCFIKDIEYGEVNYNYKGFGKGVKTPIKYDSRSIYCYDNIVEEIVETVLNKCFSQVCETSIPIPDTSFVCHNEDNSISPFEGQKGMMMEFKSEDRNVRSSLFHCSIDFVLTVTTITTLKILDLKDVTQSEIWSNIYTGIEDYLFKKEHNYQGYSMGEKEKRDPINIELWKDYWEKHYK